MERNTPYLLMLMTGLLLGRFVPVEHLVVAEITGLLFLAFCHRSDILNRLGRFVARPQVRAYVAPRYAQANRHVVTLGVVKTVALAAAALFGGLLLILDAMHRAAH